LISQRFGCCRRRRRIFDENFDDEKEKDRMKDRMKNANDEPQYPVNIRYLTHGRSQLIYLFSWRASESTEVSDAVDTFFYITDSNSFAT
jgi:hypothetical protein